MSDRSEDPWGPLPELTEYERARQIRIYPTPHGWRADTAFPDPSNAIGQTPGQALRRMRSATAHRRRYEAHPARETTLQWAVKVVAYVAGFFLLFGWVFWIASRVLFGWP